MCVCNELGTVQSKSDGGIGGMYYLMVRRVRRRPFELLLQARKQRGHLSDPLIHGLVLCIKLRELVLVGAPRTRTGYGRVLPGTRQWLNVYFRLRNNEKRNREFIISSLQ